MKSITCTVDAEYGTERREERRKVKGGKNMEHGIEIVRYITVITRTP